MTEMLHVVIPINCISQLIESSVLSMLSCKVNHTCKSSLLNYPDANIIGLIGSHELISYSGCQRNDTLMEQSRCDGWLDRSR